MDIFQLVAPNFEIFYKFLIKRQTLFSFVPMVGKNKREIYITCLKNSVKTYLEESKMDLLKPINI